MPAKKEQSPTIESIIDTLISLGKSPKRVYRVVCGAAIDALDKLDKVERRRQAKADRFTRKGDRRPIEAVEKGKKTVLKSQRRRARQRGDTRRAVQSAKLGARRFRRELSATAVLLSALEPGRWYLRGQIRAACRPELPEGAISALLGNTLLGCPALLEKAQNPNWDGIRGSLRPKGADTRPERRSQWRYRLTQVGEATRAEILADTTRWTARARWKMGLENARAVPQPHSRLGRSFYGLAGSGRS